MRIGELSQQTNVSVEALRYYEKRGLIRSERQGNGYRDFDVSMVRMVELLRLGQTMGFSLTQMHQIIAAISTEEMSAQEVDGLLSDKVKEIEAKIEQLFQIKALLSETRKQVCPIRQ